MSTEESNKLHISNKANTSTGKVGGDRKQSCNTYDDFIAFIKREQYQDLLDTLDSLPIEKQRELWDDPDLLNSFNMSTLINCDDDEAYEQGLDYIDHIEECGFDADKHYYLAWSIGMFQISGEQYVKSMRELLPKRGKFNESFQ